MLINEEGIDRISISTEMLIRKVFKDFYNLAIYSVGPKMFKIKNEGFKKLVVRELRNRDEKLINIINHLNSLHLEIIEIKEKYKKLYNNQSNHLVYIHEYPEIYRNFIEALSLKMFTYGVKFGLELKSHRETKTFRW